MEKHESISELDVRMTDECKAYVGNFLKTIKPIDSIKLDIKTLRKSKVLLSNEALKLVNFDKLDITEFTVRNTKDNIDIQVKNKDLPQDFI